MLCIHGLVVIPRESSLKVTPISTGTGSYFNFKVATESKPVGDKDISFSYWECSMFIHKDRVQEWEELIQPGNVFYIESGTVDHATVGQQKFPSTRVSLEERHFKSMEVAFWVKK